MSLADPALADLASTVSYFLSQHNNRSVLSNLIARARERFERNPAADEGKKWAETAASLNACSAALEAIAAYNPGAAILTFDDLNHASLLPALMDEFPGEVFAGSLAREFGKTMTAGRVSLPVQLDRIKEQRVMAVLRAALVDFWKNHGKNIRDDLEYDGLMRDNITPSEGGEIRRSLITPLLHLSQNPLSSTQFLRPVNGNTPLFHMHSAIEKLQAVALRTNHKETLESYQEAGLSFKQAVQPHIENLRRCNGYNPARGLTP